MPPKNLRHRKFRKAATYPAHDAHANEKLTVAADPYNTAQKASIFRLKYLDKGILPVNIIITNEGGSPVSLSKMQVQFVVHERHAKLSPLDPDDIARRMTHAKRNDDVARTTNPLPFPPHSQSRRPEAGRPGRNRSRPLPGACRRARQHAIRLCLLRCQRPRRSS